MLDVANETFLTMTEAVKILPGRPNIATLWRWRTRGVRGVKLESCLVGGRRYTSRAALDRFIERSTAAGDGETVKPRTSRERQAAISLAERELDEAGI